MASVPAHDAAEAQSTFARTLLDEFARGGMREVVVCPGSRSTPLVLAALATPSLRLHVRLDERSAGFFAIGRSLATGAPVGVVVTSGTAAAELTASVVEADLADVPIVVMTADRPPELRGIGAAQTIDQVKLYGGAVRRYEDPGCARPGTESTWRALASRVLATAVVQRGPVHLNLPFVEPLDAPATALPAGRADGAPWRAHLRPALGDAGPLAGFRGRRVLVVVGRGCGDPDAILAAADLHCWPVLADPLSGARREHRRVVTSFDALVADAALRARLAPDVVITIGAPPASRALGDALAAWSARVVAVAHDGWPDDPHGLVSDVVVASPGVWATALSAASPLDGPRDFAEAWRVADDAAQLAFEEGCANAFHEPSIARALTTWLAPDVPLVVSNSMPIRDVEWFGARVPMPPRVLANRGANGIDGVVSTALGVAAGARAVALLGDLAFLHDAGALGDGVGSHGGSCVLLVVDNRGGGIFSFLPQRSSVPTAQFEQVFATPPRSSVASVALGHGAAVHEVKDLEMLRVALDAGLAADGVTVVVASVPDRDRNVEVHRELADRARGAARAALGN